MSCSVLDGHKILWEFETEVYPRTLNWRGSSITFDDKNRTVTFEQDSSAFGRIILVTPNIMTISDVSKFENQSEKISKSPNGKFRALVQSKENTMEFLVTDSNQNIVWRSEMINCSSTIDWKNCNIVWDDGGGTVIYDYESFGNSYFNKFYLRTPQIIEPENGQSFAY